MPAGQGVWFRSGTVSVHRGVDPRFRPATKAHPAFRKLRASRITIVPDELRFDGKEHCYIADPFDNRIELINA
jgi:hypothetical protein